jgi:Zinc-finger double-stranded RNA-binding/Zinc-finger of C2H2 type
MNSYYCNHCNLQLNSNSQWDQHVSGTKHMKKAYGNSNQQVNSKVMPVLMSQEEVQVNSSAGTLISIYDFRTAYMKHPFSVILPDGSYKCAICGDICTGRIPYEAHIKGKKHLKKLAQAGFVTSSAPQNNILNSDPSDDYILLDAEESIRQAKNHSQQCCFEYPEDFPTYSLNRKVAILTPHFGFIPVNQPVPDMQKLFI